MFQHFSDQHFLINIFLEASSNVFHKCSNIFKNVSFVNYFFSTFCKMSQHFFKCWTTFLSTFRLMLVSLTIFVNVFQNFAIFRNVGTTFFSFFNLQSAAHGACRGGDAGHGRARSAGTGRYGSARCRPKPWAGHAAMAATAQTRRAG
jgi:hypothetical protein